MSNWKHKARLGWNSNAGEESGSTYENYRQVTALSKSIGDLQFSHLYQRFLDHLLQTNYIEYYVDFLGPTDSKGNFSIYFQFYQ